MKSLLSLFIALLFCPAIAHACWITETRTESMEPFTIKISNTYFQIPESYVSHFYEMVPAELGNIRLRFRLKGKSYWLLLAKYNPHVSSHRSAYSINDIELIPVSGTIDDDATNHLKSLASNTPPATWEKDFELAEKLGLHNDPCEGRLHSAALTFADIKEASDHRNLEIRSRAAALLADEPFRNVRGAKELLLGALQDEAYQVRRTAVLFLATFAKDDASIITAIQKLRDKDESKEVRQAAESALRDIEP